MNARDRAFIVGHRGRCGCGRGVSCWLGGLRRTRTLARWVRYSTLALRSACGSASAAASWAASSIDGPGGDRVGDTAVARIGTEPMLTNADSRLGTVAPGGDADDRPVLGAAVELLEAPAGTAHLRHPDLGQDLVGSQRRFEEPDDRSPARRSRGCRRDPGRRRWRRAPASSRADPRPDRHARSSRRSCRDGAPGCHRHAGGVRQQRHMLGEDRADCLDVHVAGERPDRDVIATVADVRQIGQIRPISINTDGCASRSFISGNSEWPPARNLASSPYSPINADRLLSRTGPHVVKRCRNHH